MKNIFLLFSLILLSGCAQLSQHADTIKPTAKLTGVKLSDISFDKVDLIFDLAVENQNPVALKLAGMEYNLKVAEKSLVSGVTAQEIKIAADSTSSVQLPVSLKFDDLKKLPGELWNKDTFAYQLDTIFNLSLPIIGNYAIPVSKQGELPVPKIPKLSIKNVKVDSLNFTSADLIAQVEVDNPNNFDIAMRQLTYQLSVNNQPWGKGNISQTNTVPSKGKTVIDIPVNVDLLTAGTAAYKALINKSAVDYQLNGNATLDTSLELLKNINWPLDIKGSTAIK